jgi:hypothetical protein
LIAYGTRATERAIASIQEVIEVLAPTPAIPPATIDEEP